MTSRSVPVSQKEYLKKYLTGSDSVKKRRKKKVTSSSLLKRSQIIDDDVDLRNMRSLNEDELDLYQMNEDAPQIVGIIDERPAELKAQEYYNSKRWKIFADNDNDDIKVVDQQKGEHPDVISKNIGNPAEQTRHSKKNEKIDNFGNKNKINETKSLVSNYGNESDSDQSLHKKSSKHGELRSKQDDCDSDNSSQRISSTKNNSKIKKSKSYEKIKHLNKSGSDSDLSPPRTSKSEYGRDSKNNKYSSNSKDHSPRNYYSSKSRRDKSSESGSDLSPPRMSKVNQRKDYKNPKYSSGVKDGGSRNCSNSKSSRDRSKNSDSDLSPPRISKLECTKDSKNLKYSSNFNESSSRHYSKSKNHRDSDSDLSPARKFKSDGKHTNSSRMRNENDSDLSPQRKANERYSGNKSEYNKIKRTDEKCKTRNQSDSDLSPCRKTSRSERDKREDGYHIGKRRDKRSSSGSPRNSRRNKHSRSPTRKSGHREHSRVKEKNNSDSDLSPPRNSEQERKKRNFEPDVSNCNIKKSKMEKTLDGKVAGLQDAKNLKKELTDFKNKEDQLFAKMSASVSGEGAAPVLRDRKTGKIRNLDEEKVIDKEKAAKDDARKEKYSRWGKGLKQVEDAAERVADAIKEMSKPLARYADDEDLDKFLRAQEREGDPMLDYIKRKQSEAISLSGCKPQYQGSFTPNRFGIRPGHRWDGVDRSNGYEKKWFTHQNARKARDEEAYKWSTSDM